MSCPHCTKLVKALATIRAGIEVVGDSYGRGRTRAAVTLQLCHTIADGALFDYGQEAGRELLKAALLNPATDLPDHPAFGCTDPVCKFHHKP